MRIVFFGSGAFAVPTLRSIIHDGHEVAIVVTQPDRPSGRGKRVSPTAVKAEAEELGVPIITPEKVNDADVVARLKSFGADLGYVAAFGQKIGAELLNAFPAGMVNLHASLLPALRGAAPIQWAVVNGLEKTGVTVFRLVEKMDAGPILVQRWTAIDEIETADELHDRLSRIGCDAVRATLELLSRDPQHPGTPQDASQVTLAPKLKKKDGLLRFDQPAAKVAARINGLWSWPGAMCRYVSRDGSRDEPVTLARARAHKAGTSPATSSDACAVINDVLRIQAADAEVEILEIKPAGGRRMEWRDFVNGRHVQPGDRFASILNSEQRQGAT